MITQGLEFNVRLQRPLQDHFIGKRASGSCWSCQRELGATRPPQSCQTSLKKNVKLWEIVNMLLQLFYYFAKHLSKWMKTNLIGAHLIPNHPREGPFSSPPLLSTYLQSGQFVSTKFFQAQTQSCRLIFCSRQLPASYPQSPAIKQSEAAFPTLNRFELVLTVAMMVANQRNNTLIVGGWNYQPNSCNK